MDYVLELGTPVRHVATELERAEHALSVSELAATYTHPNSSDLVRIKKNEGVTTDEEATVFLIEQALKKLARYITNGNGTYALAVPFDSIRLDRHKIDRIQPKGRFEDSFDPMSAGRFADNIRNPAMGREKEIAKELRESMKAFGWVPELPAIRDERGVVLMGHRRLAVAKELGIEPVFKDIRLGSGDAADARRFAISIASNLGGKPLSPSDRKDLAMYLYGEQEWSYRRIGEALGVSKTTVERDLVNVPPRDNPNPGPGHPKNLTKHQQERIIHLYFVEGKKRADICQELFGSRTAHKGQVDSVVAREVGAREERARVSEPAPVVAIPEAHVCVCSTCGREDIHEGGPQ